MATTRRTSTPPALAGDEPPFPAPASVVPAGVGITTVAPPAPLGDFPDIGTAEADPRQQSLNALLEPPVVIESDKNPPPLLPPGQLRAIPPVRSTPPLEWAPEGRLYLVCADIYPRLLPELTGDQRWEARAGDTVRLPDDERTRTDVAAQYLMPLDPAADDGE